VWAVHLTFVNGFKNSACNFFASSCSSTDEGCPKKVEPPTLGHKNDLVVWLKLQPMQRKVYEVYAPPAAVALPTVPKENAMHCLDNRELCRLPRQLMGSHGVNVACALLCSLRNVLLFSFSPHECREACCLPGWSDFLRHKRLFEHQKGLAHAYPGFWRQDFLESDAVRAVFNQTSSALAALTVLKKICDHPALLTERSARLAADGGTSPCHKQ
jgi:hypothetical protein